MDESANVESEDLTMSVPEAGKKLGVKGRSAARQLVAVRFQLFALVGICACRKRRSPHCSLIRRSGRARRAKERPPRLWIGSGFNFQQCNASVLRDSESGKTYERLHLRRPAVLHRRPDRGFEFHQLRGMEGSRSRDQVARRQGLRDGQRLRLAHLPKDISGTAVLLKNLIVRTSIELPGACCYYSEENLAAAYNRHYQTIRTALKALRDGGIVVRFSLGDGKGYAHYPAILRKLGDCKGLPPNQFIQAICDYKGTSAPRCVEAPGASTHPVRPSSGPGASTYPLPGVSTPPPTRCVYAPQDSKY